MNWNSAGVDSNKNVTFWWNNDTCKLNRKWKHYEWLEYNLIL